MPGGSDFRRVDFQVLFPFGVSAGRSFVPCFLHISSRARVEHTKTPPTATASLAMAVATTACNRCAWD
eukprot:15466048-Alexandrium_andersonii.AAC.1